MTGAVRAVFGALGAGDQAYTTFPDSRQVSLALWRATRLELLNALVRAHGALSWCYQDADREEIRATGLRHRLTLYVAGGTGLGVLVR